MACDPTGLPNIDHGEFTPAQGLASALQAQTLVRVPELMGLGS